MCLDGISDEAKEEIDAICSIYGPEISIYPGSTLKLHHPVCICMECKPHTGGNAARLFAQVLLSDLDYFRRSTLTFISG